MTKSRTFAYRRIEEEVARRYRDTTRWPAAKRWLARVGLARLAADDAAGDARGLLSSINLNIHSNEPELHDLLVAAREAADAYATALWKSHLDRFEGRR